MDRLANYHAVWVMGCLFSQLSSCPGGCTTFKLFDQLSNCLTWFLNGIALLCISKSGPTSLKTDKLLHTKISTTRRTFLKEVYICHIVPGLCPWALAAQTSKIEGRWLHGGGASMVQLSQWKRPPKIQSYMYLGTE